MNSSALDVSTYILEAPMAGGSHTPPRPVPDFEEAMEYGRPCYKRNGEVEVGFASQRNFVGLYILRTNVMAAHKDKLKGKGITIGKGASRYSKPEKIDFHVVESMLRATMESSGPIC